MTRPRPLKHLFGSGPVQQLFAQARHLKQLSADVCSCVEPDMVAHTTVAAEHDHSLVLLADSAAWATRLRYQTPQLLRCLTQFPHLKHLQRIEVKVAPITTPIAAPTQHGHPLSHASAELIEAHAESISYLPLRAALMQLARRGKK